MTDEQDAGPVRAVVWPAPTDPITVDVFIARWPMAAEKCELIGGVVVWSGFFTEWDRRACQRAFPGRVAKLTSEAIELHPAADTRRPRPRTAAGGALGNDGG